MNSTTRPPAIPAGYSLRPRATRPRYRSFLLNRFQVLKEEAKRDTRMADFARCNTHPDIESARRAMQSSYEYVKAPTIRWVGDDIPVPPEAQAETVVTP